jgi:nucleotide-binding universal stress UspA family protein
MSRTIVPRVFRSILCPVDFSQNSRAALRYAAMLTRLSNARLFVLHVNDPLLAAVAASRPDAAAILGAGDRDLRRFVSTVVGSPASPMATTLLTIAGKPAREIVNAAQRHRCDLIVIGYRGAGRASRLLFGSTTEGVMRTSTVPVLAVPPARRRARLPAVRRTLKRAS